MNNFDANFDKIYEEACKKYSDLGTEVYVHQSNEKDKRIKLYLIILVICGIIFFILGILDKVNLATTILMGCLAFIFVLEKYNSFFFPQKGLSEKDYKEELIKFFIQNYDSNLDYSINKPMDKRFYDTAEFERYQKYTSQNYIFGHLNSSIPMQLSNIHTENISLTTSNSDKTVTVFNGLFSCIKLSKNIQSTIKIRTNANKGNLQMDSQEFENNFDIYTENRNTAMRLLTADIMNYMINFKNENKIDFELTIKNNFAYLRIHNFGSLFYDIKDISSLSDEVYRYAFLDDFKYIDFMCELNKKIYNVIQEKDI